MIRKTIPISTFVTDGVGRFSVREEKVVLNFTLKSGQVNSLVFSFLVTNCIQREDKWPWGKIGRGNAGESENGGVSEVGQVRYSCRFSFRQPCREPCCCPYKLKSATTINCPSNKMVSSVIRQIWILTLVSIKEFFRTDRCKKTLAQPRVLPILILNHHSQRCNRPWNPYPR